MVKLKAPATSLNASGSVGGSITFSAWKGRSYLRYKAIPKNPRSGAQVGTRGMFTFLTQQWAAIDPASQATWDVPAADTNISPFNSYLGKNTKRWRRFRPPGIAFPVSGTGTLATYTFGVPSASDKIRSIELAIWLDVLNDNWGLLVFRGDTGFATAVSNLIHVHLTSFAGSMDTWLDTPLEPARYFYNFRLFTKDGKIGPQTGEKWADADAD